MKFSISIKIAQEIKFWQENWNSHVHNTPDNLGRIIKDMRVTQGFKSRAHTLRLCQLVWSAWLIVPFCWALKAVDWILASDFVWKMQNWLHNKIEWNSICSLSPPQVYIRSIACSTYNLHLNVSSLASVRFIVLRTQVWNLWHPARKKTDCLYDRASQCCFLAILNWTHFSTM